MKEKFHSQIVRSLVSHLTKKKNNMLFLKYYSNYDIPVEDYKDIKGVNFKLLYHKFEAYDMQGAYEPFMRWIRELYYELFSETMSVEEFVKECNVYYLQRIIFVSYINDGLCYRQEEPFPNEVEFEQEKLLEGIINIYNYISKKMPLVIVLDKLHLSCSSVLDLLAAFVNKSDSCNIAFECSINESYYLPVYMQNSWSELYRRIVTGNLTYDVESLNDDVEMNETFIFEADKIPNYLNKIRDMIYTLSFQQALYYIGIIHEKIIVDKAVDDIDIKAEVLNLYATIDVNTNNPEHALLICEDMKSIIKESDNLYYHYNCNYLLVMSQIYFKQRETAEKLVEECMAIAEKLKDKKLVMKTELAYHLAIGLWCDMLFSNIYYVEPTDAFLEEILENGYINSAIYLYGLCKERSPEIMKKIENGMQKPVYFGRSLKLAYDVGNTFAIVNMYNRKHVYAHSIGCYKYLAYITKEKEKYIHFDADDDIDYSQSSAYMCSQREEYEESHRYATSALSLIYNNMLKERYEQKLVFKTRKTNVMLSSVFLKKNNIQCIEDILHNLSVNCISAGDYQMASEYLLTMINIMESENCIRFTTGNISKIYTLAALCYYYMDVYYNCYLYEDKAERHMRHMLMTNRVSYPFWDDSLFFYRFVKGLLLKADNNLEQCEHEFELARKNMEPLYSSYFYIYPLFAIEQADLYRKQGREHDAIVCLEECIEYCKNEGLKDKCNMLYSALNKTEYVRKIYDFTLKGVTIEQILDAARYDNYEIQYSETQNDNAFINSWQEIMKKNVEYDTLVSNSMEIIKSVYNFDAALYIKVYDEDYRIEYNDTNINLNEEQVKTIINFLYVHQTAFITHRIDKNFDLYKKVINIFGYNHIVTLVCIPVIRESKLDTIFVTFQSMLENFNGNDKLLKEERLNAIQLSINQLVDTQKRLVTKLELESSLRREEQANEAKSTFLANMSHEIRTPMNTVVGLCEIVLRNDLSDEVRDNIEGILSASNNLLTIINDILDFSKIESGKMDIICSNYSLSDVISDLNNMFMLKVSEKNVKLSIEVDKDVPDNLYGDDKRLRQILINLLSNAVKFTSEGQIKLTISKEMEDDKTVLIVSVSDTGMGIKEDDLSKLFESFQRVDMQKNRNIEGTGLGLVICKTLLELMGGCIWADSEYGKGSVFTFRLPQTVVDEDIMCADVYDSTVKNKGLKSKKINITIPDANILVVDDNEMNLKVAHGLLQPYKMNIDLVNSGKKCLQAVALKEYDLILLDHMMPEMDGIETLKNLRNNPSFNTPVVALTANAISGASKMYIDNGFNDYLSKPIDLTLFEDILVRFLRDKIVANDEENADDNIVATIDYNFEGIDLNLGLHYCNNNVNV
nr:response regulator [Lachnospiraceae bacterium]